MLPKTKRQKMAGTDSMTNNGDVHNTGLRRFNIMQPLSLKREENQFGLMAKADMSKTRSAGCIWPDMLFHPTRGPALERTKDRAAAPRPPHLGH